MKRLLAAMGAVLWVGCATSGPTTLDEATRPLGRTSAPATAPAPAAKPKSVIGPNASCTFDAECPQGHRCEAGRASTTDVGTCIASAETPHS